MLVAFCPASWRIIRAASLLPLLFLPSLVLGSSKLLIRDGPVTGDDLIGYGGTSYQAIRYEPLCGTLGSDARFSGPISLGSGRCAPAMDVYSNLTSTEVGLYDLTGVRLKNAIVGGGTALCMCFALSQSGAKSSGLKGDICIYADGAAQADVWWSLSLDSFLASEYRPGASKSLPLCSNIDLDKAKADWSATATQPSVTERVTTLGNVKGGGVATVTSISTVIQVSTFIPSVVDYTFTSTFVTTDSQGRPTTVTQTQETKLPVVTTASQGGGLSSGDKIALGVGLGIGLPTILLMLIGLMHQIFRARRRL